MEKEVADKATELMQENIDTEVMAKYTPVSYVRTGLLRESVEANMEGDDTLVVKNTRSDYGYDGHYRDVAETIEMGEGYYNKGLDERIGARPFTAVTRQELKDGEFRKSLKQGFKNRGIETD